MTGTGAADFVNACLTNDLGRIGPGRAQYTLCCDEKTGGVVDDLIAYLHSDDDVFLIPNAANTCRCGSCATRYGLKPNASAATAAASWRCVSENPSACAAIAHSGNVSRKKML